VTYLLDWQLLLPGDPDSVGFLPGCQAEHPLVMDLGVARHYLVGCSSLSD